MEFYRHQPYNLLLVEVGADGIIIRAALDNFSDSQKSSFIRELAAEGFIPDQYQWLCNTSANGCADVKWIIDRSWLGATPALMRKKSTPWVLGMFGTAALLFLALMSYAVLHAH